jgi:hypothetical protein
MRTLIFVLLLSPVALPQTAVEVFRKAPPATDAALRERVTKFYQSYVDKKWRLSDEFVAEDTKDRYYAAPKAQYHSFHINEIKFEENFTKAIVLSLCEQDRMIAMGNVLRMKVPTQSYWKLVDGKWMWYLPERNCVATPMGCGAVAQGEAEATEKQKKEIEERIKNPPTSEIMSSFGFVAGKERPVLSPAKTQVERIFKNQLSGYLVPKVGAINDPDVEASFEPAQIAPMSEGKLIVKMKPGASFRPRPVTVEVEVFSRILPVVVAIEGAPPAQK